MSRAPDVVVVEGGVIGCAVAYYAAKRGLQVTLVDQPKRGRATSASAGGLWPLGESVGLGCGVIFHKAMLASGSVQPGHDPEHLPKSFLDFAMQSNAMFPELAEVLRESANMDVELERTSLLFLMYDEGDEAFARPLWQSCPCGRSLIEWLTPEDVARSEPALTRELRGALRFNGDDQVNPYRTADALRAAAVHHGARLLAHSEVIGIEVERGRVVAAQTRTERLPCDVVVNAAGAWAGQVGRMAGLDIPVHPVRGQIVCTDMLPPILTACVSTADCYLAQKHHGEVIIGSTTEDVGFDPGVTPGAIKTLCAGAVRAVPALDGARVVGVPAGLSRRAANPRPRRRARRLPERMRPLQDRHPDGAADGAHHRGAGRGGTAVVPDRAIPPLALRQRTALPRRSRRYRRPRTRNASQSDSARRASGGLQSARERVSMIDVLDRLAAVSADVDPQ
jgi:hydrogen cyanide synthase HcnC